MKFIEIKDTITTQDRFKPRFLALVAILIALAVLQRIADIPTISNLAKVITVISYTIIGIYINGYVFEFMHNFMNGKGKESLYSMTKNLKESLLLGTKYTIGVLCYALILGVLFMGYFLITHHSLSAKIFLIILGTILLFFMPAININFVASKKLYSMFQIPKIFKLVKSNIKAYLNTIWQIALYTFSVIFINILGIMIWLFATAITQKINVMFGLITTVALMLLLVILIEATGIALTLAGSIILGNYYILTENKAEITPSEENN
ncbi:MAG: DUF4013 domain-containing protein [Candidatus Gastranaerophilales bacterium]|nr:DUF4013 domain-containing protein [Candidatus Gastranaerophilales bacterium]